ncbi:MAG: histidine kinase [Blautia sp.]|nr:histidine kinase [Blautia sp.]
MNRADKKKKNRSLATGMVRMILTYMLIPYIVLSAVLIHIYTIRNQRHIESTVTTSLENTGKTIAENIYSAIEMSRQASYDGVIKSSYETYLKNYNENLMYREVSAYLSKTYKFSKTISNTILMYDLPMTMEYYTYSNVAGATYANIDEFKRNAAEAVRLGAKDLGTKTRLTCIGGHLYVVRNIVLSNYEPFVTLVMEVNMDRMFESLNSIIWKQNSILLLDEKTIYMVPKDQEDTAIEKLSSILTEKASQMPIPMEGNITTLYDKKEALACMLMKVNGQEFYLAQSLDRNELIRDGMAFISAYIAVFIALIPLLIATFYYFYTNINKPVGSLIKGSEKIRKGEYGYKVEPFDKNEEMGQLVDTFNHMSGSLEDSFKRIYVEEIAERDATLKALQAQINPHFLNNTLEIINWKARMSGNEDVSEMITALSVMMNATLNRNNEMYISLEEELSYVDAYLHIIQERFGSKFTFTQTIDHTLLDRSVPRLIIQPIIENAVEHGGNKEGRRSGELIICEEDGALLIRVKNNGEMTQKDREKIDFLLNQEHPDSRNLQYPDHESIDRQSIGIRNVHLRLRMIYGNESGLTIESDGNGMTVSTIRIKRIKTG